MSLTCCLPQVSLTFWTTEQLMVWVLGGGRGGGLMLCLEEAWEGRLIQKGWKRGKGQKGMRSGVEAWEGGLIEGLVKG